MPVGVERTGEKLRFAASVMKFSRALAADRLESSPTCRRVSVCIGLGRLSDVLLGMFVKADVNPGVGRSGELGQGLEFGEAEQCGVMSGSRYLLLITAGRRA
jgi:hypothetical protein